MTKARRAHAAAAGEGALDDRVLRVEAGEAEARPARHLDDADPGDGQSSDRHRPEGDRDLLPQRAVEAHVLLVMHGVDHRAGAEEEQGLEEGVGEEVEHRRAIGADSGGEEHVAQLRAGRIGDHPLDVVLNRPDGGGEDGGRSADHGDDGERGLAGLEHRRQSADHEHARRHHGRGVDQGGDRGRALHRVGQPGVKTELRRFAHRSDEQEDADQGHRVEALAEEADRRARLAGRGGQDLRDGDGSEDQEGGENAQREAEIADPVDDEGLERRGVGRGLVVPEADEEVGCEADALPAEEHLDEIVGGHQHQHREGEQRQIGEEARLAVVLRHIAPAVEVDERRHRRHHHQHHRGQGVDPKRPVHLHRLGIYPRQDRVKLAVLGAGDEAEEDRPGQSAGGEQCAGRDQLGDEIAEHAVAEPGDDRREKRQEDDELDGHAESPRPSWRAKRSNPVGPRRPAGLPRRFAPRNDGLILTPSSDECRRPRSCLGRGSR